jgi:hypothetical protein
MKSEFRFQFDDSNSLTINYDKDLGGETILPPLSKVLEFVSISK